MSSSHDRRGARVLGGIFLGAAFGVLVCAVGLGLSARSGRATDALLFAAGVGGCLLAGGSGLWLRRQMGSPEWLLGEQIVRHAREAIVTTDQKGRVCLFNPAAE